jgi:tetratricopeptide (TPR) repeat protein
MRFARPLAALLVIVACLAGSVSMHRQLADINATYPAEFRSYYIPSSTFLKIASLGQRNFWADLIFIWSIQYFDRYGLEVRDDYLFHTYDVITDLDPLFHEAYVFGNLFLSIDRRWDLIYKLTDKGLELNPKNWILAWDAGTYAFFQQKDYTRALDYFRIAMERNPTDARMKKLVANAYKYRGDYEDSLLYWKELRKYYETDETTQGRFFLFAAERNIFDLTIKIDLRNLQAAVDTYKTVKGRLPSTLDTLVRGGFLKFLPLDPEGKNYLYDPVTGSVSCQTPFKFRGKYAQW